MGRDWNEPRDKGPPIEERERCHKRRGGKRPFVIEQRYVGPKMAWLTKYWESLRTWHTYSRYKTEKARTNALRALRRKAGGYEYRAKE